MSFEAAFKDGLVAVKAGKGMIARLQFEQVTELAPEFADGWLWLAWTSDTPDKAEKHLRKALELDSKNELTRAYLDVVTALRDFEPGADFSTFRAGSPAIAAQSAEQEQTEQERAKQERAEQERAEQERAEQERAEQERAEQERAEQERAEQERAEQERAEQERAEQERAEQERAEQERAEQERAEQEESNGDEATQAERERAAAAFAFIANKASEVAKTDEDAELDELAEDVQELRDDVDATLASTDTVDFDDLKAATESDSSAAAPGDAEYAAADEKKPTVLVVDDSPTVRKIVTMTLEADGYEVVSAEDGVEATKILVTFSPNLILLDINMPRMGGYKLCKLIKAHPDTSSIPVIMLSGKDGLFDKLRGKLVGCNDYISKPFESADLLKCVREHINLTIPQ